jgi:hypothetical protein
MRLKASPFWGGWRGRMETGRDRQINTTKSAYGRLRQGKPVFEVVRTMGQLNIYIEEKCNG